MTIINDREDIEMFKQRENVAEIENKIHYG